MLTDRGQGAILELLQGYVDGATLRVFESGEVFADAPLDDGFPAVSGHTVVVQATFGADAANFEWKGTAVLVGGEVIDSTEEASGTKAPGSVWTAKHTMELATTDGD